MMESANLWKRDDLARFDALDRPGDRTVLTPGQVSARAVIVGVTVKTLSNYVNHAADTPLDTAFEAAKWAA